MAAPKRSLILASRLVSALGYLRSGTEMHPSPQAAVDGAQPVLSYPLVPPACEADVRPSSWTPQCEAYPGISPRLNFMRSRRAENELLLPRTADPKPGLAASAQAILSSQESRRRTSAHRRPRGHLEGRISPCPLRRDTRQELYDPAPLADHSLPSSARPTGTRRQRLIPRP